MDGRCCIDNIFVERLWRSLKYEEVFLHACENMRESQFGIGNYLGPLRHPRPREALIYQTPKALYRGPFHEAA